MRIVLSGYGSIGRRHLANIRRLEPIADITILRHCRADENVPKGANAVTFSLADAVALAPDIAFICGPATTHAAFGLALAGAGAHLFVEKPLASDRASARLLLDACKREERILAVGYNLRFSPALLSMRAALQAGAIGRPMSLRAEAGQYLPEWRPGVNYRESASARAELGGGVTLELSHEFDYVRWLLGEVIDVRAFAGCLGDLEIDVEDTAEAILTFDTGALASVHIDMVQRVPTRTCRIIGVAGTLIWDAMADTVVLYRPDDGWRTTYASAGADRNAMYLAEIANFFAAVRGECEPTVSGADGFRALEIALAVRQSSNECRLVRLHESAAVE